MPRRRNPFDRGPQHPAWVINGPDSNRDVWVWWDDVRIYASTLDARDWLDVIRRSRAIRQTELRRRNSAG